MQVIIRFSVDDDTNSILRNRLNNALEKNGFSLGKNTATYRNGSVSEAKLSVVLAKFWDVVHTNKGSARVDHFWMYSDFGVLNDIE